VPVVLWGSCFCSLGRKRGGGVLLEARFNSVALSLTRPSIDSGTARYSLSPISIHNGIFRSASGEPKDSEPGSDLAATAEPNAIASHKPFTLS
jgi:hypothetical protein